MFIPKPEHITTKKHPVNIVTISGHARNGKDTTAAILKELIEADGQKVLVIHFADLVKFVCEKYFGWNGKKDEKGRTLLQYVGTDRVRTEYPDYWVDFVIDMLDIFDGEWDWVLIPDTRFPNEIDKLKENGFNVIHMRIQRDSIDVELTEEQKNHLSETALDNARPDVWINNSKDIPTLRELVADTYESIKEHLKA